MARNKPLEGQALREDFIKRMEASRENMDEAWEFPGALGGFKALVNRLPQQELEDMYSMNFGFSDISDLDYLVIRADILIERSLRSLASEIANNPLPPSMKGGAVINFITLMESPGAPYLKGARFLSAARNTIAHELHPDYSESIRGLLTELGLAQGTSAVHFKSAIVLLISQIANRRTDWYLRKSRYASLDLDLETDSQ